MVWCRSTTRCQRFTMCRSRLIIPRWPRSTPTSTCEAAVMCTTGRPRTRGYYRRPTTWSHGFILGSGVSLSRLPFSWPPGTRWVTTKRTRTKPTRSRWPSSPTDASRSSNSCTRHPFSGYNRSAGWPRSDCRTPKRRPVSARPTGAYTCFGARAVIRYTTLTGI